MQRGFLVQLGKCVQVPFVGELADRCAAFEVGDRLANRLRGEVQTANGKPTKRPSGSTLDPQSRFAGVEVESNNALATRFVQECETLTRSPGNPTVLVIAHSSKVARRMNQADSRGVTSLTDGFRWYATLVAKGKDGVTFAVESNN